MHTTATPRHLFTCAYHLMDWAFQIENWLHKFVQTTHIFAYHLSSSWLFYYICKIWILTRLMGFVFWTRVSSKRVKFRNQYMQTSLSGPITPAPTRGHQLRSWWQFPIHQPTWSQCYWVLGLIMTKSRMTKKHNALRKRFCIAKGSTERGGSLV